MTAAVAQQARESRLVQNLPPCISDAAFLTALAAALLEQAEGVASDAT